MSFWAGDRLKLKFKLNQLTCQAWRFESSPSHVYDPVAKW